MGAVAGVSALAMPSVLGFGREHVSSTPARTAMTFAWYLIGGLAAGAAISALARRR
jgi:hypothetical protein